MDTITIPGGRDVRATLDGERTAPAVVVACPPHPQMGGSRSDERLVAVSDALVEREIACLRFDYGPWDGDREARAKGAPPSERTAEAVSRGERQDAVNALAWAKEGFERVGLFGYSFGAGIALIAAAESDQQPAATSVLAPPSTVGEIDVLPHLDALTCPLQVVYGERDDTVAWRPVVEAARDLGADVASLPADHHFVGQSGRVGELVGAYFAANL